MKEEKTPTSDRTNTFDGQTAHFLGKVGQAMPRNLPKKDMQRWIDSPVALQQLLRTLVLPENVQFASQYRLLSGSCTKEELRKICSFSEAWGGDVILNHMLFAHSEELCVVPVTVKQLGFPCGAAIDEILRRALDLELNPIPKECVAAFVASAYLEKWVGLSHILATDFIVEDNKEVVFLPRILSNEKASEHLDHPYSLILFSVGYIIKHEEKMLDTRIINGDEKFLFALQNPN